MHRGGCTAQPCRERGPGPQPRWVLEPPGPAAGTGVSNVTSRHRGGRRVLAAQTRDQNTAPCQRMRRGGGAAAQRWLPGSHTPSLGTGAALKAKPRAMYRDTPGRPTGADTGTSTGPWRHGGARSGSVPGQRAQRRGRVAGPAGPAPPAGQPPGAEPWPRRGEGKGGEGKRGFPRPPARPHRRCSPGR